jgi:DnaK suppressor protein
VTDAAHGSGSIPSGTGPVPPGSGPVPPDTDLDGARDRDGARELLDAERAAATAAISALTRDFDGIVEATSSVATDDEHDPEGATIAFERAQVMSLLERARGRLADVDLALARIADGSYGSCERCGQPIGAGRLAARPAARTCIRCASPPAECSPQDARRPAFPGRGSTSQMPVSAVTRPAATAAWSAW